jgi:uncharacterized protein (TIGR02117 family)
MQLTCLLYRTRMLALLCLGLACGGCLGPVAGLYPPRKSETLHDVYVCNNGWHTGIILSTSELSPCTMMYLKRFAGYPWIEIGWGDDRFYRTRNETVCLALQAMFFSRGSVLHVVGVWPDPKEFYQNCQVSLQRLRVGEAGYRRMEQRIFDSFQKGDCGQSIELEPGLYGFSRFYAATGHYWLGHTCNNWTAEALRQTGFPITPVYAITADNVTFQLTCGRYRAERVIDDR